MGNDTFKSDIAVKVKLARQKCGLTQVEMANILNIARQTYLDLESGKTEPRVSTIKAISEYTQYPLQWFLDDSQRSQGHERMKESKDVMELILLLSRLPKDLRNELLRSSVSWARLMLSYTEDSSTSHTSPTQLQKRLTVS